MSGDPFATCVDAGGAPCFPERFNLADYYLDHHLEAGRGERVALQVGDATQTYAALIERSRRVTAALRALGVRPEERVLLVLPDGFEYGEAFFGILRAGGVFAMVNPLLKRADYDYYLAYTKARVVITAPGVLAELAPAAEDCGTCETVLCTGSGSGFATGGKVRSYEDALAAADPAGPDARVADTSPDDLAGWLFTSGSTGHPKACVHTQSDFAYSTETYAKRVVGYGPEEICLGVPKLFFGYATGTNLMFPLRFGGRAVLFSERSTADQLFDLIERTHPTLLTTVPTMIGNMLRSERMDQVNLSCLRVALSAGEALPEPLLAEWMERTGVEVLDGIGSAEMFHIYVSNHPGDVKPGSLGKPVVGYEVEIVDAAGQPVAEGDPGRLRVKGHSTALCYWGDKNKSRETFQADWCTTSDVFRRDADGYFFYEGRTDDLMKVSGIWVAPKEIEECLLTHPAVSEVCVVAKDTSEGLTKPLAFIVPAVGIPGDGSLNAALKEHVKSHLAPHKYPRWIAWREELPKNDRGKIARKDLRSQVGGIGDECAVS